jgi:electron transport complex protein RnfA
MSWTVLVVATLNAMLINNVILSQFLGVCPFLGVSKKSSSAVGMSGAVMFVMIISSLVTYTIYALVLVPFGITYIQTIAFILVIASLVQLVEILIKKFSEGLYKSLGIYLPLITTNCAILGVAEGNISSIYSSDITFISGFTTAGFTALGTALGFGLVMFAFSSIRERLDSANIGEAWKGIPISLVTAGIMSIAFLGLKGII